MTCLHCVYMHTSENSAIKYDATILTPISHICMEMDHPFDNTLTHVTEGFPVNRIVLQVAVKTSLRNVGQNYHILPETLCILPLINPIKLQ